MAGTETSARTGRASSKLRACREVKCVCLRGRLSVLGEGGVLEGRRKKQEAATTRRREVEDGSSSVETEGLKAFAMASEPERGGGPGPRPRPAPKDTTTMCTQEQRWSRGRSWPARESKDSRSGASVRAANRGPTGKHCSVPERCCDWVARGRNSGAGLAAPTDPRQPCFSNGARRVAASTGPSNCSLRGIGRFKVAIAPTYILMYLLYAAALPEQVGISVLALPPTEAVRCLILLLHYDLLSARRSCGRRCPGLGTSMYPLVRCSRSALMMLL